MATKLVGKDGMQVALVDITQVDLLTLDTKNGEIIVVLKSGYSVTLPDVRENRQALSSIIT